MAIQARTEFAAALNQLASEKGVDVKVVIEAIEQAALAAFRKDLSLKGEEIPEDFESLTADINPSSGEISIMRDKTNITPPGFARIAAQTAKQVIMQRLNEAEKGAILDEYAQKVGTVISGTIQRQENNTYFVDLGRAEGVFPQSEQTRDEYYHAGQRLKFYIREIRDGRRGPEVVLSRSAPELVKGLFALEVPEIQTGSVVIKDIAREAGNRSKIAAISTTAGVDPVGSLVGQKGVRVITVMNELGEEKIDIIAYSEEPVRYIASALSPAKDVTVTVDEKTKVAKVQVPASQLSLAIGKGGQNVRLAAKLTGWKIDIEGLELEIQPEVGQPLIEVETPETVEEAVAEVVAEEVSKEVDKVMAEESVDGAVVEEPSTEEAKEAVAVAEEDMEKDSNKNQE
ncbi:MAG: transcription termination factor NusA [Candidatus Daviesbacteria bacterium]|nr:transcription termination factor NusA [Candidatus Daviesbacteria bacterium]